MIRPVFRLISVSAVLIVHAASQDHPVRSRGTLDIPQTHCWNFDDAVVGGNGQPCKLPFDFWYEAVNPTLRYLVPSNNAALVIVGNASVGYRGCANSDLSKKRINFSDLRRGMFLCARTNQGRYVEFLVDDFFDDPEGRGLTLRITYKTWER